ncbi:MAG: winged helix-turn-helix transcriptional regulator [Infirmifilum sp.]
MSILSAVRWFYPLALFLVLFASVYLYPALGKPYLLVTSGTVSGLAESGNETFRVFSLQVFLPPLTKLAGEKVACAYNSTSIQAYTSLGSVEIRKNCVYLSVENTGSQPIIVNVEIRAFQTVEERQDLGVYVAAVAAVSAVAYLSMTESGREKVFTVISIPVSYYVTRREDVARSEKRVRILEYIRANPGVSMRRISRETDISFGEVQWHLSILERLGLVKRVKIGKRTCYYPSETPLEVWLPSFLREELGVTVDSERLRGVAPRLELFASRGNLPLSEISQIISPDSAQQG